MTRRLLALLAALAALPAFAAQTFPSAAPATVLRTLTGFEVGGALTHWDQKGVYNALTPHNRPCGCVAVAGAALLEYWQPATVPPACSRLCNIEGESDVTLTTVSEAYDWFATDQTALDELRGRVTYNLGVRLGMHYGPLESFCSLAELPAALAPYGLDSLHTSVQQGGVVTGQTLSDEALERGVYGPLRVG